MKKVAKSKTEAIKYGKQYLRELTGLKRISCLVKYANDMCGCGETIAIKMIAFHNNSFDSIIIPICSNCNNI